MKVIFLIFTLLNIRVYSKIPFDLEAIYGGVDDRAEVKKFEGTKLETLSESVAASVPWYKLFKNTSEGKYTFMNIPLREQGMCETVRFKNQPSLSECTGYLVSEELLVTAGHCMRREDSCEHFAWVFDYRSDKIEENSFSFENVYGCEKILDKHDIKGNFRDFAVIKLDKKVTDREWVKYRKIGRAQEGEGVYTIGHPLGLPMKIAPNGAVIFQKKNLLVTSLDTFYGNSGSPVFNEKTNLVDGILIGGHKDFLDDDLNMCQYELYCTEGDCDGEEVLPIEFVHLERFIPTESPLEKAYLKRDARKFEFFVNFGHSPTFLQFETGKSFFTRALEDGWFELIEKLYLKDISFDFHTKDSFKLDAIDYLFKFSRTNLKVKDYFKKIITSSFYNINNPEVFGDHLLLRAIKYDDFEIFKFIFYLDTTDINYKKGNSSLWQYAFNYGLETKDHKYFESFYKDPRFKPAKDIGNFDEQE